MQSIYKMKNVSNWPEIVFFLILIFQSFSIEFFAQEKILWKDHPIYIGVNPNVPPYRYVDDKGMLKGFDIDLVKSIADKLNFEYELILQKDNKLHKRMILGTLDLHFQIINQKKEEHDDGHLFQVSYDIMNAYFITPPNSTINTIKQLQKKKIGVIKESFFLYESFFKDDSLFSYILLDKSEDVVQQLLANKIDAWLCSIEEFYYLKKKFYKLNDCKIIKDFSLSNPLVLYIKDKELAKQISLALNELKAEGEYDKIAKKWFAYRFYKKENQFFMISMVLAFILMISFFSVVKNYYQRKKIKQRIKEFNQFVFLMIEKFPYPFFVKEVADLDNIMNDDNFYCSESSKKYFKGVTFTSFAEYVTKENAASSYKTFYNVLKEQKPVSFQTTLYVKKMRRNIYIYVSFIPFFFENRRFLLGIMFDMTELHKAQLKAEKANNEKTVFLANISHEIRTPLNAILGFSELLESSNTEEERDVYNNIITQKNEELKILINNILTLAKIESYKLQLNMKVINIDVLLKELEMQIRYVNKDKLVADLHVYYPKSLFCQIDRNCISQCFIHFVNNAIKFTPSGIIQAGILAYKKQIYVYCLDTGIGISLEEQVLVFDNFEKLSSQKEGTGLGLALCRSFALLLDGEIGVISVPNKGSFFWFSCPDKTNGFVARDGEISFIYDWLDRKEEGLWFKKEKDEMVLMKN